MLKKITLSIIGAAFVSAAFVFFFSGPNNLTVLDGSAVFLTADEQSSISEGMRNKLYDASSAQFRRLVRSKTMPRIICGEVNAKNKFGAYVGFVPFSAGLIGPAAMIAMPSADVAESAPEAVRATQRKLGCDI